MKIWKKIMAGALVVGSLACGVNGGNTFAAVAPTDDNVIATLSMGGNYATGTTQWYYSGGTRTVQLYYYYVNGNKKYYSYGEDVESSVVSNVTLNRAVYGAESYGAKSSHKVVHGNHTWGWVKKTKGIVPNSLNNWKEK